MFQSTRPRGARPWTTTGKLCRTPVSIHAPARGAAPYVNHQPHNKGVSIHAPARGAAMATAPSAGLIAFQSTRPRGARRGKDGLWSYNRMFQSTRPRGARQTIGQYTGLEDKFQSTRPRGARRYVKDPATGRQRFNPRARAGRGIPRSRRIFYVFVSIHAPARGAARHSRTNDRVQMVSIHAPARGAAYCM